ncbi:MAG: CHAP domain-containing protein [Ligilactobacillus sp.]|nr:CHAP domain-containing protein [Ligilactobacillus sp.]
MFLKKVITSTVALSMLAVSVLNTTTAVSADTVSDTQNAINTNKSETDKLLKDIASANADNIKLQEQISDNTEKIDKLKTDIDKSNEKINKLNGQIEGAKVEVEKRTEALKGQLVALQKKSGDTVSGNIYLDFVINSEDFSDLVSRTFAVNKLNQANKEALNDVKEAKDQYTALLNEQEKTKANLQSDKSELETKQNDLKSMKEKSDQQQADLNKKIEDNKATLVALQSQYEEAANAVKLAQDKANATAQVADAKKDDNKSSNNDNKATPEATSSNAGSISQGDGSTHGIVAGNTYPWGQCTWYVKQVAPWAGNNWGNGGQWGSSAAAAGFRVDHSPAAGSIIVFLPGQSVGGQWTADGAYGHVAYVESVNGNSVTISQGGMGFSNPAGPNTQTISGAGSYIYIHR